MAWTTEQDQTMSDLWEKGHTVAEIAKRLEKHPSAVKARRVRLNLKPRRTGDLTEKVKVWMHKDTMSLLRQKARRTGQTVPARVRMLIERDMREP